MKRYIKTYTENRNNPWSRFLEFLDTKDNVIKDYKSYSKDFYGIIEDNDVADYDKAVELYITFFDDDDIKYIDEIIEIFSE